jgi:hypothetical protein
MIGPPQELLFGGIDTLKFDDSIDNNYREHSLGVAA